MGEKWLIKNGIIPQNGQCKAGDILIDGEKIADINPSLSILSPEVKIIDARNKLVCYGLADVHVHFREPGFSYKETIRTGSLAAAHGGYTTVCAMPNLDPAPDSLETLQAEQQLIDTQAVIGVKPYATITKKRKGEQLVDFKSLVSNVVGFSDDGSGVQSKETMERAMKEVTAVNGIIAAHCEDNKLLHGGYIHAGRYAAEHGHKGICSESEWGQIARDLELAEKTGCHYHVCHISTKESVDIIRQAKKKGVCVTCETAPHYLTLTEDDLQEQGCFKMNPPLRSKEDQEALIEGILDGTIDCIATDHAPHSAEEKSKGLAHSAMGIVGLETAFPIIYTQLVRTGIISLEKMLELMCTTPREIFHLGGKLQAGEFADISIFDIENPYTIDSNNFFSKGHSTPFDGWEVFGKCVSTIYHGKMVWNGTDNKNK